MNDVVSMKVDEGIIKNIIGKQIQAAIVAQVGDPVKLIEQAVKAVLNKKVDKEGRHRGDSYYDKYDYLEMLSTKYVHKAAERALQQWLEENAAAVAAAVKKEMSKPPRTKMFAVAMAESAKKALSRSWNIKCHFDLKDKGQE